MHLPQEQQLLPLPEENELTGEVLRSVFSNPENGYGVVVLKRADGKGEAMLAGSLSGVMPGVELCASGQWVDHPRFGRQFQVATSRFLMPRSLAGIRKYLAAVLPGVSDVTAEAIVDRFGEGTLEVIDKTPEKLLEVTGIGRNRLARIIEAWKEEAASREDVTFLLGIGISYRKAHEIVAFYKGYSVEQVVTANPYRLGKDIEGIGFLTCDKLAGRLGIDPEAQIRVAAGLAHTLLMASQEGNVFLPKSRLLADTQVLLRLSDEALDRGYQEAIACNSISSMIFPDSEEPLCYLPEYEFQERSLAALLNAHLLNSFPPFDRLKSRPQLPGEIELNQEQLLAVRTALAAPVSIITGGPGVGKTTVVRRIVEIAKENKLEVKLAAPTGRAAKRLAESAQDPSAATIHRMLKFDFVTKRFEFNQDNPLKCDLLVVDEVSMLDLPLAKSLLAAVPPQARLVLVGDKDQLPSVGPGAVLHDLIECGRIPVVSLWRIYRQASGSRIITSAHEVNEGHVPSLANPPKGTTGEFYFYENDDPQGCQDFLVRLCSKGIPEFFGYNPMEDIQVLTPMRKGECGTIALNRRLQEVLNPPSPEKPELTLAGGDETRVFRLGDRVMQIKNNYDNRVFNGDMGRIVSVDREQHSFRVAFDSETVVYRSNDCKELLHAYAITIHKSQGCEFPVVVTPLLGQHYVMLQRNLLYTAITRAKRLYILTGSSQAVRRAVQNNTPMTRMTRLAWRLKNPGVTLRRERHPRQQEFDGI